MRGETKVVAESNAQIRYMVAPDTERISIMTKLPIPTCLLYYFLVWFLE